MFMNSFTTISGQNNELLAYGGTIYDFFSVRETVDGYAKLGKALADGCEVVFRVYDVEEDKPIEIETFSAHLLSIHASTVDDIDVEFKKTGER